MRRHFSQIRLGGGETRFMVRIEGDDCELGTQEARFLQWEILRQIIDQPDLVRCGLKMPEKLRLSHNGQRWVVECEAVDKTPEALNVNTKTRSAPSGARREAEEQGAVGGEARESPATEETGSGS